MNRREQITAEEVSIENLLSGREARQYATPSFQRPYSWEKSMAQQMLEDVYDAFQEQHEYYFLGSIVLVESAPQTPAWVIDGQQRLTTITILLSALVAHFNENDPRQARVKDQILREYLWTPEDDIKGIDSQPRIKLRENGKNLDQSFLQAHFLSRGNQELDLLGAQEGLRIDDLEDMDESSLPNESQRKLRANGITLFEAIKDRFFENKEQLREFTNYFVNRCYLVKVSAVDDDSAIRIFHVMNDRGCDLQSSDIAKAEVLQEIQETDQQEYYAELWDEMERLVGRQNFERLLRSLVSVWRGVPNKWGKQEKLNEACRELARKFTPEVLISEKIKVYTEAEQVIQQGIYELEGVSDRIEPHLRWIRMISNPVEWKFPALIFLKQAHEYNFSDQFQEEFFRRFERYAFWSWFTKQQHQHRQKFYWVELPRALIHCTHEDPRILDLLNINADNQKTLYDTLQEDWPNTQRNSERLRYLLLRLDELISDDSLTYQGHRSDAPRPQIEHILPQNLPQPGTPAGMEWREHWDEKTHRQWVNKIANMVLIAGNRNKEASNYGFASKKEKYFCHGRHTPRFALTIQVIQKEQWTPEVVRARQEYLMSLIRDAWGFDKI